jgi:glycine/serine hydroxymethyltransferase
MNEVAKDVEQFKYHEDKEERKRIKKEFNEYINNSQELKRIRAEVIELCKEFPIYK